MAADGFISRLRNWSRKATCRSPVLVGAWVYGYIYVDESIATVWHQTADVFSGPDGANAASRSLLNYPSDWEAFDALIDALSAKSLELKLAPVASEHSHIPWIEFASEHLSTRPAMILGGTTMALLVCQVEGYLAALELLFPDRGSNERERLAQFERWLQQSYGCPTAAWSGILRGHFGDNEFGIKEFVRMWDKFNVTVQRTAP